MKINTENNYSFSDSSENFEYNITSDTHKPSILDNLSISLNINALNYKIFPIIKILESYGLGETLIKFEIFKNVLKVSICTFDIFSDVLMPLNSESILKDNEYFSFVIDSEKLIKIINIVTTGDITLDINKSQNSLIIHYQNLTLNLNLKLEQEMVQYQKHLVNRTLVSNEFHCDNIKNGLDFCNLIFSKSEETAKTKQIQLSNNLIYSETPLIGSSAVFFESFGNLEYSIGHNLIKVIAAIFTNFKGSETKVYKTEKFTIFKDSNILFGIPNLTSAIDNVRKGKIEKASLQLEPIYQCSLNRKNLIQSLSALSIFLNDLQDESVLFTFNKDLLKISVIDQVTSKESFDIYPISEYTQSEIKISLKFDSILKNLKFFQNRQTVDIQILKIQDSLYGIRIIEEHNSVKYGSFFLNNE